MIELKTFKGDELENIKAKHPFMNRDSKVILSNHVTLETGTGCVHIAPAHGLDDYHAGMKYGLPVGNCVDPAGRYTDEVPQYKSMKIWEANKKIVEDLQASGHMLSATELVHSYPHNPRTSSITTLPFAFIHGIPTFLRLLAWGESSLQHTCK